MSELPDFLRRQYPFRSHWARLPTGERLHYVDEGAGRPVLLLHGNPTWSFLYRKVIAALQGGRGGPFRTVAPDLLGLGLSDKPRSLSGHSVQRHGEAVLALVEQLDLRDVVLCVQDWGGPVGTWMAAHAGGRVTGLVVMNTSVLAPTGFRTTAFHRFARMPLVSDVAFRLLGFPLNVLGRTQADPRSISGEVQRAYRWPLRHMRERVAPLAMARMVPSAPDHPSLPALREGEAWVRGFKGPVELVWGVRDPILGRALRRHREALPHARVTELEAGHFLQEEKPEEIAEALRRVAAAPRER